ncbi:hypothetical protein Q604_UNBC18632G0007 [human gut metagenome]|uniref:Uncharacterized protein n=1 Tax=human gut metagenome TaxID=408170 RepID=W1WKM5_9ZZZZ|nr:hypothetical protein [Clostridium butyricum]AXB84654.1 hypothetical protein DRB99_06645 [Clostridium butyricum]
MDNREYIAYLNSLHNYNAQNQNAYGEKNVESTFFNDVMVKVGLCDFIYTQLVEKQPHIIILTGHAGDGKTSVMYQVLDNLGIKFDPTKKKCDINLPDGKTCMCIKDFSELADDEKVFVLKEVVSMPDNNKYVFMVANTGPLINTYGQLFENEEKKEKARIELIDAMDKNTGNIENIMGHKICVINVATVDNTYFASEFLGKLVQQKLWDKCNECSKKEYCHIFINKNLIVKNKQKVFEFINMHYVWLTEYGQRLTIRSMTEQLSYMITGGYNCEDIVKEDKYKYLFSNLFFGYIGTGVNTKAMRIIAVNEANMHHYDFKRLRSDENLLVSHNYSELFSKEVADILEVAEKKNAYVKGWSEFLRRTYMFLNIVTDEKIIKNDSEDIFSKQFKRYLELRNGESNPSRTDANLISDALSMIYIGTTHYNQSIPLTLSRESGISQNVQLVTGSIFTRKLKVIQKETRDSMFNKNKKRYVLMLEIDRKIIDCELSLPMLDYFEELKNGIISTNIDPQLSHGMESLKSQISKEFDDSDDDSIEIIILKNTENESVHLEITEDNKMREI